MRIQKLGWTRKGEPVDPWVRIASSPTLAAERMVAWDRDMAPVMDLVALAMDLRINFFTESNVPYIVLAGLYTPGGSFHHAAWIKWDAAISGERWYSSLLGHVPHTARVNTSPLPYPNPPPGGVCEVASGGWWAWPRVQ